MFQIYNQGDSRIQTYYFNHSTEDFMFTEYGLYIKAYNQDFSLLFQVIPFLK